MNDAGLKTGRYFVVQAFVEWKVDSREHESAYLMNCHRAWTALSVIMSPQKPGRTFQRWL
jgi:hypothetical protein